MEDCVDEEDEEDARIEPFLRFFLVDDVVFVLFVSFTPACLYSLHDNT